MEPLEQRVAFLEGVIAQLLKSDRYTIQKTIQLFEGRNIQIGTSTGSSFGTATTQKISVYGVTPVVQAAAIGAPTAQGGTYNSADANTIVTAVNNIRTAIKNYGITA